MKRLLLLSLIAYFAMSGLAWAQPVVVPPAQWQVNHNPGAAAQATASKGAAAATRHVALTVTASFACAPAANASVVTVNLRDGASGAGTVIWTGVLNCQSTAANGATASSLALSGLNLVGTNNTAMTLEFSGAGAASTQEAVTLTGYDLAP